MGSTFLFFFKIYYSEIRVIQTQNLINLTLHIPDD